MLHTVHVQLYHMSCGGGSSGADEQKAVQAFPEDAALPTVQTLTIAAAAVDPVTAVISELSDEEDEEGSQGQGDESSVEYAADTNESPDDDEATLEEEEVLLNNIL